VIQCHIPGERYGQIVFKSSFRKILIIFAIQYIFKSRFSLAGVPGIIQSVVQDLKDQFVTFIAIFPHKRFHVFHGRGLKRLKPV
jgi:hypothetical protein